MTSVHVPDPLPSLAGAIIAVFLANLALLALALRESSDEAKSQNDFLRGDTENIDEAEMFMSMFYTYEWP